MYRIYVFLLFVFFSSLPYLPNSITAIILDVPIMGSFSYSPDVNLNPILGNYRFLKEIFLIGLALILLIDLFLYRKKKSIKLTGLLFTVFTIIFNVGVFSLLFTEYFSLNMIIAGSRILLFIFIPLAYISIYMPIIPLKKIYICTSLILITNFILTILQARIINNYYGWNLGGSRLVGGFEGSGNLATFVLSYSILLFVFKFKDNLISNKIFLFFQFISLAVAVQTGTRVVIVLVVLILFSSLYLLFKNTSKTSYIDFCVLILGTCLVPLLLNFANYIAGRGNAFVTNFENGRFTYIFEYLSNANFKEIIIGRGMGFGTNTALSLGAQFNRNDVFSIIVDGTYNTIITQFGFIGFMFTIFMIFILCKQLINNYKEKTIFIFTIIFVFLVISFIGNIIEHFSYLIITIYTFQLLLNRNLKNTLNPIGDINEN